MPFYLKKYLFEVRPGFTPKNRMYPPCAQSHIGKQAIKLVIARVYSMASKAAKV